MISYTPGDTANALIAAATINEPNSIVDFCAGNGGLLLPALARWPRATLYANDVDRSSFGTLADATWSFVNFLDSGFDDMVRDEFPLTFDLILLNPPFAFDRAQLHEARGRFADIRCSLAFAFLFTALDYLDADGELLAIMPTSTLKSERDSTARRQLAKFFNSRLISGPRYNRFPGLDVSTYLIGLRLKQEVKSAVRIADSRPSIHLPWQLTRGAISQPKAKRVLQTGRQGWIHTTSIQSSKIVDRYKLPASMLDVGHKVVGEQSIVLPRVGRVKIGDIALTSRPELLSDCLLGVTFDDRKLARLVYDGLKDKFSSFAKLYTGTGAPYITHKIVSDFVRKIVMVG